ncbi:hypothetical protein SPPR111872_24920 [Sphingobacterium prati]
MDVVGCFGSAKRGHHMGFLRRKHESVKYRSPSEESDLYCLLITWILCQVAITRNGFIGYWKTI